MPTERSEDLIFYEFNLLLCHLYNEHKITHHTAFVGVNNWLFKKQSLVGKNSASNMFLGLGLGFG